MLGERDLISTSFYDLSHKAFRMVTATNDVLVSSGLRGRLHQQHPPTDAP